MSVIVMVIVCLGIYGEWIYLTSLSLTFTPHVYMSSPSTPAASYVGRDCPQLTRPYYQNLVHSR